MQRFSLLIQSNEIASLLKEGFFMIRKCHSPDSSENPFVPAPKHRDGTKD